MATTLRILSGLLTVIATAIVTSPLYAYDVAAVSGGGSIEGVVVYKGDVPTKKIIPTKDVEVCGGPRGAARQGRTPTGRSRTRSSISSTWPRERPGLPPGKPPELNNLNCRFEPEVQVIPAGPLDVVNKDPVLHNTHGYYGKRTAFNMALPNEGQVIPTELKRPAQSASTATRMAGWRAGSTWSTTPTTRSPAPTANSPSPTSRRAPTSSWRSNPLPGPIEMPVTVTGGQATKLDIELKKQ